MLHKITLLEERTLLLKESPYPPQTGAASLNHPWILQLDIKTLPLA